jgi:uncharacterized protein (TIGR02266 family)
LSASGKRIRSTAENISRGGLFARTDEDLPVGTLLRIDVVRPGWKQALTLGGRVVRKADRQAIQEGSPPGVGVEFGELDEHRLSRLQQTLIELRSAARPETPAPPAADPQPFRIPLPPPAADELQLFRRRCEELAALLATRDAELARLRVELQAARARLRAIDIGPGSVNRSDS